MAVTIGINGYGHWGKFTYPCICSVLQYEPTAKIVVVDNGSDPSYPFVNGVRIVRTEKISYSAVMNLVVALGKTDWYLILNNDTLCTGRFLKWFDKFSEGTSYGCSLKQDEELGRKFIETWMIAFSQESYERIGPWDENYAACSFEDADWGFRATQAGVNQEKLKDFPFKHLGGSRWETPGYGEIHASNRAYLESKFGKVGNLVHVR